MVSKRTGVSSMCNLSKSGFTEVGGGEGVLNCESMYLNVY